MKHLLTVTMAVICLTTSAYAAELTAQYNMDSNTVVWQGKKENSVGEYVKIEFLPYSVSPYKITENDISVDKTVIDTVRTRADGDFSGSITLNENFKNGKYNLWTFADDEKDNVIILKLDQSELEKTVKEINASSKSAEIKQIISVHADNLGLDIELFGLYGDGISKIIFSMKPSNGYTYDVFVKTYCIAEGLLCVQNGKMTASEFLSQYSAYTGLNNDWRNESDAVLEKLTDILSITDFNAYSFEKGYCNALFTARAVSASGVNKLEEIVIAYCRENNISLNSYYSLNEYKQLNVMSELFSKRTGFKNAKEIIDEFQASIKDNSGSKTDGGTGGGGGGGTSGKGSTASMPGIGDGIQKQDEKTTDVFTDISNHWAKDDISLVYANGFINGYDDKTFRPDANVTRAEFTKIAVAVLGLKLENGTAFSDVDSKSWYGSYVYTASINGVVNGISDDSFAPDSYVSRQDAAVIIYRSGLEKGLFSSVSGENPNEVSDYARDAMTTLSQNEIMSGDENGLRPHDNITRAEAAVIFNRLYKLMK